MKLSENEPVSGWNSDKNKENRIKREYKLIRNIFSNNQSI